VLVEKLCMACELRWTPSRTFRLLPPEQCARIQRSLKARCLVQQVWKVRAGPQGQRPIVPARERTPRL